jgi:hypothetical protein
MSRLPNWQRELAGKECTDEIVFEFVERKGMTGMTTLGGQCAEALALTAHSKNAEGCEFL